jgi:hypothetical protein
MRVTLLYLTAQPLNELTYFFFVVFVVFAVFAVQNTKLNQRHLSIDPDWAELAATFFTNCQDLPAIYQHF